MHFQDEEILNRATACISEVEKEASVVPSQGIEGQEIPEVGAAPPKKEGENTGVREQEMAREPNPVKRLLRVMGPGLITGASDDDPSGIGTYSAAGATLGYSILWTSVFTFPMMASTQYICAKVGMETGMGLAGVLRRHYPSQILYPAARRSPGRPGQPCQPRP